MIRLPTHTGTVHVFDRHAGQWRYRHARIVNLRRTPKAYYQTDGALTTRFNLAGNETNFYPHSSFKYTLLIHTVKPIED